MFCSNRIGRKEASPKAGENKYPLPVTRPKCSGWISPFVDKKRRKKK